MSELRSAQVDQRGLLRVLGENLYSTPEVALRELVQNAHDSCMRRRIEQGLDEPSIAVVADPGARALSIRDNGAGLTREEIDAYLATIGAGYTRLLRERTGDDALIGAFGLGFLSAYAVSERVEVVTTSYQDPGITLRFLSRDGMRYTVEACEPRPVGTEVRLHLAPRFEALSQPGNVQRILERYCGLLDVPVACPQVINADPPAWRVPQEDLHPHRVRQLYLETARRFARRFAPLGAIPVRPGDGLRAEGVLWLQDGGTWSTADHRDLAVYVRGMLVSDDARDLLPDWAGFVGGVVVCDALTPTASREDVQRDPAYHRLAAHLRGALVAGLCALPEEQPAAWRLACSRHNDALVGAALADPRLFDLLRDTLELPTSEGPLPMPEIAREGRVALSVGDDSGYEQLLHRAAGRPVVDGTRFGAAAFARRYAQARGLPVVALGTAEGDARLFPRAAADAALQARLDALFGEPDLEVRPSRFSPAAVPLVLVPDREALLKRRIEDDSADRRLAAGLLGLARQFTAGLEGRKAARLYVNLDNPTVSRALAAPEELARPAAALLKAAADLSARSRVDGLDRDVVGALQAFGAALEALLGR